MDWIKAQDDKDKVKIVRAMTGNAFLNTMSKSLAKVLAKKAGTPLSFEPSDFIGLTLLIVGVGIRAKYDTAIRKWENSKVEEKQKGGQEKGQEELIKAIETLMRGSKKEFGISKDEIFSKLTAEWSREQVEQTMVYLEGDGYIYATIGNHYQWTGA